MIRKIRSKKKIDKEKIINNEQKLKRNSAKEQSRLLR